MISKTAFDLCLNMVTFYLMMEAYYRRPVGFHGSTFMVVTAHIITQVAAFMFGYNLASWINQWSADVQT